jgi:hypothetical protein
VIAFPTDDRPSVTFTARCPCGHPDATWMGILALQRHALDGSLATHVVHEVHCPPCVVHEVHCPPCVEPAVAA